MLSHASSNDAPRRRERPGPQSWFEDLAGRLDDIRERAASAGWRGWSAQDAATLATAAHEIRAIPEALAVGAREAFVTGRDYGHREERLDQLDREITVLSSLLAQEAWGGRGPGRA